MFFEQKSEPIQIGDSLKIGTYQPHSYFSKVVNLKDHSGKICFVTTLQDNLAPNTIYFTTAPIADIKALEIGENFIKVNEESVAKKDCLVYHSDFDLSLVNTDLLEKNLLEISKNHTKKFPPKSLSFLLNRANLKFFTTSFEKAFAQNAINATELILSGKTIEGVKMIKGTGFGLTPSGDDFISGLLFGLHYNQKKSHIDMSLLISDIYQAAVGKNELVNTSLYFAKEGKYFSRLKKSVILLSGENDGNIDQALKLFFSMGATSGADLLTGYLFSINHSIGI